MDPTHEWIRAQITRKKDQLRDHDEKIKDYEEEIAKHEGGKLDLNQEIGILEGHKEILGFVEE